MEKISNGYFMIEPESLQNLNQKLDLIQQKLDLLEQKITNLQQLNNNIHNEYINIHTEYNNIILNISDIKEFLIENRNIYLNKFNSVITNEIKNYQKINSIIKKF